MKYFLVIYLFLVLLYELKLKASITTKPKDLLKYMGWWLGLCFKLEGLTASVQFTQCTKMSIKTTNYLRQTAK